MKMLYLIECCPIIKDRKLFRSFLYNFLISKINTQASAVQEPAASPGSAQLQLRS